MKKIKGISLIVLVITIIVIIILAGAVLLSLSANNPISQASKATFSSDIEGFQTELNLYVTKQYSENLGKYDPTLLQADESSVIYDGEVIVGITINDLIPSLVASGKYAGQFVVIYGKLVFQGTDVSNKDWATEAGIEVITAGEPKVTILTPNETVVLAGTDIIYTIKFSSNVALTTIDLTGKVEVLDNAGVALPSQPAITIGTVSGTNLDVTRQVNITIKTDSMSFGSYKLKINAGVVTNASNISNTQNIISLIGFDISDSIPPENPTMSANPVYFTNGNVTVTITYSIDSLVKEYSLDAITWNSYTVPIVVTENNTTVYARGKDANGNVSGVATFTVTTIDRAPPDAFSCSVTSKTNTSITISGNTTDILSGIRGYRYSKDNGVTWTAEMIATNYEFTGLAAVTTYQCKMKAIDNVNNEYITNSINATTATLVTYSAVGSQTFTVPVGVTSITVECWGATGGSGATVWSAIGGIGGYGGYGKGTLAVSPGEIINIVIGTKGVDGVGDFIPEYSYIQGYPGLQGGSTTITRSGTTYINSLGGSGGIGGTWDTDYDLFISNGDTGAAGTSTVNSTLTSINTIAGVNANNTGKGKVSITY